MLFHSENEDSLGPFHSISRDGMEVNKAKTDLIVNLPYPACVKEVRSFLRYASFYYRFIKDFSKITKPLTNLLAKDMPFHFSRECRVAFAKLKEALTSTLILHPPIWGEPFQLICDTFDYAIRVVLGQRIDENPSVMYYISHTFNDAELNYIVIER